MRGKNGTVWRSQVFLANRMSTPQQGVLRIVPRGGSAPGTESLEVSLEPGAVRVVPDLYEALGAPAGSGALELTGGLTAWVRTFNRLGPGNPLALPDGATVGQEVPAISEDSYFDASDVVFFPASAPVDTSRDPRSNLLLQCLDSDQVYHSLAREPVDPGANVLVEDVGGRATDGQPGTVVLKAVADGRWNGYISTIDAVTGDPTTVRGRPLEVARGGVFPGVASAPGSNGTVWKSELILFNLTSRWPGYPSVGAVEARVDLVPRCDHRSPSRCLAASTATRTYRLLAQQVVRLPDVYADLGAPPGVGTLRVTGQAMAWVRTYNQGSAGTYGQSVPVLDTETSHRAGEEVWFPFHAPADRTLEPRSNLLLQSFDAQAQEITLRVGALTATLPLPPGAFIQLDPGTRFAAPPGDHALVVTGTGRWNGYVSLVDPFTGDPTTLLGVKTLPPLTPPEPRCTATPDSGVWPLEVDLRCEVDGGRPPFRFVWSLQGQGLDWLYGQPQRVDFNCFEAGSWHHPDIICDPEWKVTVTDEAHQQTTAQGVIQLTPPYLWGPDSEEFPAGGGAGTVGVMIGKTGTWSASSDVGWLRLTSSATGTGPGSFSIVVDPNPLPEDRVATISASHAGMFEARQVGLDPGTGCGSWTQATVTSDATGPAGSPASLTGSLHAVVWSGSLFVAVGAGGAILSSPDGVVWTPRDSGTTDELRAVTHGTSGFVAVGGQTVATSPDGLTWGARSLLGARWLWRVEWGAGKYVASSEGRLFTSSDGITWQEQGTGAPSAFDLLWTGSHFIVRDESPPVCIDYEWGYECSVHVTLWSSPDGLTWTPSGYLSFSGTLPPTIGWCHDRLLVLEPPEARYLYWSLDAGGFSNTQKLKLSRGHRTAAGWTGTEYVLAGLDGVMLRSPDGLHWRSWPTEQANALYALAAGAGRLVAIGASGTIIYSSCPAP